MTEGIQPEPADPAETAQLRTIEIRQVNHSDLDQVRTLIDTVVVNPMAADGGASVADAAYDEVVASLEKQNTHTYVVVVENDVIVGMMGYVEPFIDDKVAPFLNGESSLELHHVYVSPASREGKVMARLLKHISEIGDKRGITRIVLRSGMMFMRAGWGAWTHLFGEHVAELPDYYRPPDKPSSWGWNARVWTGSIATILEKYHYL